LSKVGIERILKNTNQEIPLTPFFKGEKINNIVISPFGKGG
jgi:hypothetical protein